MKSSLDREQEIRKPHIWIPITISVVALFLAAFSLFISWRQSAPLVSIMESSDTDDPLVGVQISNDGTSVAKLKDITYYVDRKPMDDIKAVIDAGKLEDAGYFDFGEDSALAVGEKDWLLSMKTKGKGKELDKFDEFVDGHIAVEVTACSTTTFQCVTKCEPRGWCK